MLNYNKDDVIKSLKLQKIFNERWKKNNSGVDYRKDNDIFGTRGNDIELMNGDHYKKTAKEIVDKRLDEQFRVKIYLN
jgi:hypothetical protein